ncbi:hypothetical protein BLNAU_6089 [Blattamonas nauphoetae]|uniref:Uncharacterized protein n=1 Tax=Blattamonas nauphoetae TaxID=2049346 RepID=A0ABQ9Y517_9EUKA|nr:hypothetical protein BLNAU_6089 [Blattamonas nauphoetae]
MAFTTCLSIVQASDPLYELNWSLKHWEEQGTEAEQSGKRILQALFAEGFEDTLEQMLRAYKDEQINPYITLCSVDLSQKLGSNVECPEW